MDQLIRWVAACLGLQGTELATVRWPTPAEFQPDLADRVTTEWQAIVDLLAGRSRERILLFEGASGLGKSVLVLHAAIYAKKLGIPVARVDFKGGGLNVAAVLEQFDLDLGACLPNFAQQGADNTHLLRKDLRALRQPVLIIFDSYEDVAENKTVADWLCHQLLNEIETALGLAVIVAGQRVPDPKRAFWGASWRGTCNYGRSRTQLTTANGPTRPQKLPKPSRQRSSFLTPGETPHPSSRKKTASAKNWSNGCARRSKPRVGKSFVTKPRCDMAK